MNDPSAPANPYAAGDAAPRAAAFAVDSAGWRMWPILGLLMAFSFLCHFNRNSMAVAGTEAIIPQYQLENVQMGTVYAAYLLTYTCFMMGGGWVIDHYGPKRAMAWMGLGSALFVALTGAVGYVATTATALTSFWLVRSMLGIFSTPMHPGAARAVSQWVPAGGRGVANGLVTACALVGVASSFVLFGAMMDRFTWPNAFLIAGGVTALVSVVWIAVAADRSPPKPHTAHASGQSWSALFANRDLMLLTLSYVAVGYFQYVFFYWVQEYFITVVGLSKEASRPYAMFVNLAMAVGMFAGGGISDLVMNAFGYRAGRVFVPMVGMVGSALFLLGATFTHEANWVALWFSLAMASLGISEGPFWVAAVEVGGRRGGSSAAIFNTGGNLPGIFAPWTTPLISKYLSWQAGFGLACVFCLMGAALWLWIDPRRHADAEPRLGISA